MERFKVHFTYRGGRFDGRKGHRTIEANDKEEAGSRVRHSLDRIGLGTTPRYVTIDWVESLPKEDK